MTGHFLPPKEKRAMAELYEKIVRIFEISKVNIEKANRRTLLRYATRVKFQERREAFYSVCEEGTKSKVAICKTDERPTWVHNLETLKTKSLRAQLKGFLKELGAFINPKKHDLEEMAEKKNWHQVVYLDDETKEGGMATPAELAAQAAAARLAASRPGRLAAGRGRRGRSGGHPASPAPLRIQAAAPAPFDQNKALMSLQQDMQEIIRDQRGRGYINERVIDLVRDAREGQDGLRRDLGNNLRRLDDRLNDDQKIDERHRIDKDHKLDDIKALLQKGKQAGPLTPYDKKDLNIIPLEGWGGPGAGDQDFLGGGDGTRVLRTKGGNCYFLEAEEDAVCKPNNWKRNEFTKTARNKLRKLAESKAITCAKIDLLRCLTVEFMAQMKMWRRFNQNCQGDYLASITADEVKELTCKNKPVFSGPDLHTMKAVANCYAQSQNLCKGHSDVMARFNDEKVTGDRDYTMGHLCYSDLVANARKYNDPWTKAALRHRKPDPIEEKTLICETADGETQIRYIPERPEDIRRDIQLLPSVGGIPSTATPSAGTGTGAVSGSFQMSGGAPGSDHLHHIDVMHIPPPPKIPKQLPASTTQGTQTMPRPIGTGSQTIPRPTADRGMQTIFEDPVMTAEQEVQTDPLPDSECVFFEDILHKFYNNLYVHDADEMKFDAIRHRIQIQLMRFDTNIGNFVDYFTTKARLNSHDGLPETKFLHLARTTNRACLNEGYIGWTEEQSSEDPDICERLRSMLEYAQDRCLTLREYSLAWSIYNTFRYKMAPNIQDQWEGLVDSLGKVNFHITRDQFGWVIEIIETYCNLADEIPEEEAPKKLKKDKKHICERLDDVLTTHRMGNFIADFPFFWQAFTPMMQNPLMNTHTQVVNDTFMMLMQQFQINPDVLTDDYFWFIRAYVQTVCYGLDEKDKDKKKKKKLQDLSDDWTDWDLDIEDPGVAVSGLTPEEICRKMDDMIHRIEDNQILDADEHSQFAEMARQLCAGVWGHMLSHLLNLANAIRDGSWRDRRTGLAEPTYQHDLRIFRRICNSPRGPGNTYCDQIIKLLETHEVGTTADDRTKHVAEEGIKQIFMNFPHWREKYLPYAIRFLNGFNPGGTSRGEIQAEKYELLDFIYRACTHPQETMATGATLPPEDVPDHTLPAGMPPLESGGVIVGGMTCPQMLAFIRNIPIRNTSSPGQIDQAQANKFWKSMNKLIRTVAPGEHNRYKGMTLQMFNGIFTSNDKALFLELVSRMCGTYMRDVAQPEDACSKIRRFFVDFDAGRVDATSLQSMAGILQNVVGRANRNQLPEITSRMEKLAAHQLGSVEIVALRNQLLMMCEGKYPPNMKFSVYIPDPNELCTYLQRTMDKHMHTSIGLIEWETFRDIVKQLADNMTAGSRIGFLEQLQKFQSKHGVNVNDFKATVMGLCRAEPIRFPHRPAQDVSGPGDRTWTKNDTDWQALDCGWLIDRILAFIDGTTYTPNEWSEWQTVWNELRASRNIPEPDVAPVRLMLQALASGGGLRSGAPTRVVQQGLATLEGFCRPITSVPPRVPAEWAVTWANDLQKSCELLFKILDAMMYRRPIPDSAIQVSFRKAWMQIKSMGQLSGANRQTVEIMIPYVERNDIIFDGRLRPEVAQGKMLLEQVCSGSDSPVGDMSEDDILVPGRPNRISDVPAPRPISAPYGYETPYANNDPNQADQYSYGGSGAGRNILFHLDQLGNPVNRDGSEFQMPTVNGNPLMLPDYVVNDHINAVQNGLDVVQTPNTQPPQTVNIATTPPMRLNVQPGPAGSPMQYWFTGQGSQNLPNNGEFMLDPTGIPVDASGTPLAMPQISQDILDDHQNWVQAGNQAGPPATVSVGGAAGQPPGGAAHPTGLGIDPGRVNWAETGVDPAALAGAAPAAPAPAAPAPAPAPADPALGVAGAAVAGAAPAPNMADVCNRMLALVTQAYISTDILTLENRAFLGRLGQILTPTFMGDFYPIVASTVQELLADQRPLSLDGDRNYRIVLKKLQEVCQGIQAQQTQDDPIGLGIPGSRLQWAGSGAQLAIGPPGGAQPITAVSAHPPMYQDLTQGDPLGGDPLAGVPAGRVNWAQSGVLGAPGQAAVSSDPVIAAVSSQPVAYGEIQSVRNLTQSECRMLNMILKYSRSQQPDARGQAFLTTILMPWITNQNMPVSHLVPIQDTIRAVAAQKRPLTNAQQVNLTWLTKKIAEYCDKLVQIPTTGPPGQGMPPIGDGGGAAFDPEASLGLGGLGQPTAAAGAAGTGATGTAVGAAGATGTPLGSFIASAIPGGAPLRRWIDPRARPVGSAGLNIAGGVAADLSGLPPLSAPPIGDQGDEKNPLAGLQAQSMSFGAQPARGQLSGLSAEPVGRVPPVGYVQQPLSRASTPLPRGLAPVAETTPLQIDNPCTWIPSLLQRKMNQPLDMFDLQGLRSALDKLAVRFPDQRVRITTMQGTLAAAATHAVHKQGLLNYVVELCNPSRRIGWDASKIKQFTGARQIIVENTPQGSAIRNFLDQGGLYDLETRNIPDWAAGAAQRHNRTTIQRALERSSGRTLGPDDMRKLFDQGWQKTKGTGGSAAAANTQIQLARNDIRSLSQTVRDAQPQVQSTHKTTRQTGKRIRDTATASIQRKRRQIVDLEQYISDVGSQPPLLPKPTFVAPVPKAPDPIVQARQVLRTLQDERGAREALETQIFASPDAELIEQMGYSDDEIKAKTHEAWNKEFKKMSREHEKLWDNMPSQKLIADEFGFKGKVLTKLNRVLKKVLGSKKLDATDVKYFGNMLRHVKKLKHFKEMDSKYPTKAREIVQQEFDIERQNWIESGETKMHLHKLKALYERTKDMTELDINVDDMMNLFEVAGGDKDIMQQFKTIRTEGHQEYRKAQKVYKEMGVDLEILRNTLKRSEKLRKKPRGIVSKVQQVKKGKKRSGTAPGSRAKKAKVTTEAEKQADLLKAHADKPDKKPKRKPRSRSKPKKPKPKKQKQDIKPIPPPRETVKPYGQPLQAKEGVAVKPSAEFLKRIEKESRGGRTSAEIAAARKARNVFSSYRGTAGPLQYAKRKKPGKPSVASNTGPYQ